MTDIVMLNQMINNNARIVLTNKYKKAYVELIEPNQPESKVQIQGLPQDAVVIKIDDAFQNDSFFSCKNGECKRADYVIVAETYTKKVILFIEIKKTTKSKAHIIKQLKGAACAMNYCSEIAKVFYGRDKFLSDYEKRFITFGHTGIRKRKTRIQRNKSTHDSPEKMMIIDWPANIQFAHLAG